MSQSPVVLVPPRPNLGPEPWGEDRDHISTPLVVVLSLLLLLLLMLLAWALRRPLLRKRPIQSASLSLPADATPSARLLNLSDEVREKLAGQFGATIRARTTEELARDLQLREALGATPFEQLLQLLSTADRCKFAPPLNPADEADLIERLGSWQDWHRVFCAGLPSRRAASPRT